MSLSMYLACQGCPAYAPILTSSPGQKKSPKDTLLARLHLMHALRGLAAPIMYALLQQRVLSPSSQEDG